MDAVTRASAETELEELRERLRRAEAREAFLAELDARNGALSDPAEMTLASATLLGRYLHVNRCAYADVEPDQNTFNLTGNYIHEAQSIVGRFRFAQFGAACLAAMQAGEPFVMEDAETDPRVQEVLEMFRATGIRGVICCPVIRNGVFRAALAVHTLQPRQWEPHEIALVQATSYRCWESIERGRVLRDLRASEGRLARNATELRIITDALPVFVCYIDQHLRYRWANQTYLHLLGRTPEDFVGRHVSEVLGASYPEVGRHLEAALRGEPQFFEATVDTGSPTGAGSRILSITHIPDLDEATGAVRGIVVQSQDVTQIRHAEEKLSAERERFRVLSDYNPAGVFQADLLGNVTYVNTQAARMFALSKEEILGTGWTTRLHPDDRTPLLTNWGEANSRGEYFEQIYRIVLPNGDVRDIFGRSAILAGADGQPVSSIGTVEDITERNRAERALLQTEKLAAVGRLAASIAHEINNPLESVTNLLYLARLTNEVTDIQRYLDTADQQLRRVSAISNQTLRFYKQSSRPISVAGDDLLEGVLSVHQARLVNSRVAVESRMRATRPVLCFDGEIRQVLSNLIGNAIDAMHPRGGRLLLRSREAVDWKSGRTGVVLTIADSGNGMSAEVQHRVFEAFFTTKGIGGTGLGLWVSREIVERHAGRLRVRSSQARAHHGTVFTLFLPDEAVTR